MAEVPGAGGVVFDQLGRVLILRHHRGEWVFPKGHIDPGETPLQAALREVEEEAGVQAACLDPGRVFVTRYFNNRQEERTIHWFVLQSPTAETVLRETLFPEGTFISAAEALSCLSFEEDRRLLQEVLAWLGANRV
ncbi:MAG: NUDIX domain-containing protein [Truepera sp.]|nr:NUDIX domain-containing protein [Truepera sp.]